MSTSIENAQRGSTLLEVVLALLLFSIAALGLGRLQWSAVHMLVDADRHTLATALVKDIIVRVQRNPGALATYTASSNWSGSTGDAVDCHISGCTSTELAHYDVQAWRAQMQWLGNVEAGVEPAPLNTELTAAGVCMEVDAGVLVVAMSWRGLRKLANPSTHACGELTGWYDTDNSYRQLLVLTTGLVVGAP